MSFCLQVAGDGDVFPMLAIYAPYVRDTAITFEYEVPTAAEFGARLHHVLPEYPWLVCRAPGQVLGYAYAHRHMERAAYGWNVECSVYVLGSARGRGVGRALYGALLELLRLQGVVNAYGCIAVPNEPSEALHRATGFSLLGHFPGLGLEAGPLARHRLVRSLPAGAGCGRACAAASVRLSRSGTGGRGAAPPRPGMTFRLVR